MLKAPQRGWPDAEGLGREGGLSPGMPWNSSTKPEKSEILKYLEAEAWGGLPKGGLFLTPLGA